MSAATLRKHRIRAAGEIRRQDSYRGIPDRAAPKRLRNLLRIMQDHVTWRLSSFDEYECGDTVCSSASIRVTELDSTSNPRRGRTFRNELYVVEAADCVEEP
jgi:hypothetical protein